MLDISYDGLDLPLHNLRFIFLVLTVTKKLLIIQDALYMADLCMICEWNYIPLTCAWHVNETTCTGDSLMFGKMKTHTTSTCVNEITCTEGI